jgi:Glycosyl transferase family 90
MPTLHLDNKNNNNNNNNLSPLPFFGFQKKQSQTGILLPYGSHGEFNAQQFSQQVQKLYPTWESKEMTIFWRGATSGARYKANNAWRNTTRAQLLLKCQDDRSPLQPYCNVGFYKYTSAVVSKDVENEMKRVLGDIVPPVPLLEQMHYQYLVLLDGNGPAAGRTEKYFIGNSVIFKTDSDAIEFYYQALKPYWHYIPVKSDLRNLPEQFAWIQQNGTKHSNNNDASSSSSLLAKNITDNLQAFAPSLYMDSVACYVQQLFSEYAKLLRYNLSSVALGQHDYKEEEQGIVGRFVNKVRLSRGHRLRFQDSFHFCPKKASWFHFGRE